MSVPLDRVTELERAVAELERRLQAKSAEHDAALAQQAALVDVLEVINASPGDLETSFDAIVEKAIRLCNATGGGLWLVQGEAAHAVGLTRRTLPEPFIDFVFRTPARLIDLLGRNPQGQHFFHVEDVKATKAYRDQAPFVVASAELGKIRTFLGVPLREDGVVVGVFTLIRDNVRPFTEKQIALVQAFAAQALVALKNARLFKETKEALEQQKASAEILEVIGNSVDDAQPVFEKILHSVEHLFGADERIVFLAGEDGLLHVGAMHGPNAERARAAYPMPLNRTTSAIAMRERRFVSFADVFKDPDVPDGTRESARRVGRNYSVAVAPMLWEGRGIGSIVVARFSMQPFTEKEGALLRTFADQAVIAIQNARLFNETRQALERQTATAGILKVIASSPTDAQPVFDAIAENAKRLVGAAFASVFRVIDGMIHMVAHTPFQTREREAAAKALYPRPYSESAYAQVEKAGEPLEFADADSMPLYLRDVFRRGIGASFVSVPMMQLGRVLGVITVTRDEEGSLRPDQIQLLQTFADQAVIAIENARLFNETQEALEHQKASGEVLSAIARSVADATPVFEHILDACQRLFGTEEVCIFTVGEDRMVRPAAVRGRVFSEARNDVIPLEESRTGRVIRERRVHHIPDGLVEPGTPPAVLERMRREGNLSLAFAPMLWEDSGLGSIAILRKPPRPFSERELDLLRGFADQAAIAIQNARMFNEVKTKTEDLSEALQMQTATSEVLKVISRSAFDLQAVFNTLVSSAVELGGALTGTICVRDGDVFRYRDTIGAEHTSALAQYLRDHPATPGRSTIAGRVLLSGKVERIPDCLADPEYVVPMGSLASNVRSLLGVPLLRKQGVEGAIILTREEPGQFSDRQVEIVQTFADQAVIALENVRLFDEVQARTKELAASLDDLRKAQDRLVQTEKLASLGQLTAGIAHEIKNPLNFVNNFSTLSRELLDELGELLAKAKLAEAERAEIEDLVGTVTSNLDKVVTHGKRADSIVRNMLLHSREGSGTLTNVDVNALVEEALNLAWHGARAEKPSFKVTIEKSLDPNAGVADLYPQEMTRVLLNLISNGFYATTKRRVNGADPGYEPTVTASTRDLGDSVEIAIRDNGTGIPDEVKAKIFNPFFTTKPAGEGTGLGLSMSHDIVVKQHGGSIDVATAPGAFTEFTIVLPRAGHMDNAS